MPFTLGFYDLFSYLIPGMLYLYGINEVLEYDQTQSLEHSVRFNLSRNKAGRE